MKKSAKRFPVRVLSVLLTVAMLISLLPAQTVFAAAGDVGTISNNSLKATVGGLGQISVLNIVNNPKNNNNADINFLLPNDTSSQNNSAHQWVGEMIFATRTSDTADFSNAGDFVEVDTNRTLAAGGSTTASNIASDNPYITKAQDGNKVTVNIKGMDLDATTSRAIKGFDVRSVYDMETEDGSLLWSITLQNTSSKYIEFGDIGLPIPWNNKYASTSDTYNNRLTVHTFAGADSGYAYGIRCSGEGNYMIFTPVPSSGARIEYVDNWLASNNGVTDNRTGNLYTNWCADTGGWFPGLSVYYIHSKAIHKTGRSYFTDASSLILAPGESKTYQFKFSAIRAGDNDPQQSAASYNNASESLEEREQNFRSILYREGMIDAVAVPSFQTAINMDTLIDLHYDDSRISDLKLDIQCVHENDPFDKAHIPNATSSKVNNSRTGLGLHEAPGYEEAITFVKEVTDERGEKHHIYKLNFSCIGNNSLRVDYKLNVNGEKVDKFTEFEFNVLAKLDTLLDTHADFMANTSQDNDPASATYGIYSDWYFASGRDSNQKSHWGDDWSHDNVNFMAMKNYLNPDVAQIQSLERYLIDFMWDHYMSNTHSNFVVANYLSASGIYGTSSNPYTRTFSEVMEATAFFNMYRIEKTYPDLMEYRQPATYYLEKAYGIYYNRAGSGTTGYYGEQQIPAMIEALYDEGMTTQANNLKNKFAKTKGTAIVRASYPYGSEFEYDNTGEEGAYSAAKALKTYYPTDTYAANSLAAMSKTNKKTRAMRGMQPTWYQYADPVFRGGESWWNFQYTASLAGYIMDDYLRYEADGVDDSPAWAERMSYGAKLSNFNCVNMGQIASNYVGSVSWRYNMYKGGYGAMNVNDGGTRVMNNGWQDFSGESDEGLYGSLLSISSDVANDAVFGTVGYGCGVTKNGDTYTIVPKDGIGKRINLIDEKIYVTAEQDHVAEAEISANGRMKLTLDCYTEQTHASTIDLAGAGICDGFYEYSLNGERVGQCYVSGNEGTISFSVQGASAVIEVVPLENGENEAPTATVTVDDDSLEAIVPFNLKATAFDDGAPVGSTISYSWTVINPEGCTLTLGTPKAASTTAVADKAGTYHVILTVSDGEKSGSVEFDLEIADAPERTAPVIHALTGTPIASNPSVAELLVDATADALYQGTIAYEWSIVAKPEGASAVFAPADKAQSKLLVDQPGEYLIHIKLTDADKVTEEDLTVTFGAQADGYQRGKNVVTPVGTAPTLPASLSVILADGSISTADVIWDEVDPGLYGKVGSFLATGTASGAKVAVTVYAVNGVSTNIAPLATPTAIINSVNDLGGVAGLNDGFTPSSSSDTSHGAWHNWLGEQAGTAWVQYTWSEPFVIDSAEAYYFRDGNGNFLPKDAKYEYLNADGQWEVVPNVSGLGVARNTFNKTTFDPIYTTSIRMIMNPASLGCGVLEWRVFGYTLDKAALSAAITAAKALSADDVLTAAIAQAQDVYDNASEQSAINDAATLLNAYVDLNQALAAAASADAGIVEACGQSILTEAIAEAKAVYGAASADAAALNAAASDLNAAVTDAKSVLSSLQALKSAITSASDLAEGDENLTAAIGKANRVLDTQPTDKEALNSAVSLLNASISLKKAIDAAEAKELDNFVPEAAKELSELIAAAKSAFAENIDNQAGLETAAATLNAGVKGLRRAVGMEATAAVAVSVAGSSNPVVSATAALNDDVYGDTSYYSTSGSLADIPLYHTQGTNTSSNTVTYTWENPVTIRACDIFFWYNGTQGNTSSSTIRFPNSYTFAYLDPRTNAYVNVTGASGYGRNTEDFNLTTFNEVTTTSLRVTISKSSRYGIGIEEWKVYGEPYDPATSVNSAPAVTAAASVAKYAISLNGSYTDDGKPFGAPITENWALVSAPEGAETILKGTTVYASKPGDYRFSYTVSDSDKETTEYVTASIVKGEGGVIGSDVAPSATAVESDYTSSWENLDGINDPTFEPTSSNQGTGQGWGNWSQSVGSEHYVGYTWKEAVTIGAADVYWYDDGGGTQVPSAYRMQYMDETGAWKDVNITTPVASAIAKNKYNRIDFGTVTTTRLRFYVTVKSGAAANGIYRFKLYPLLDVVSIEDVALDAELGTVPALPASVGCTNSDGTTAKLSVIWNDLDSADFAQAGDVIVKGISPDTGLVSTATIHVAKAYEPADDVIALIDAIGEVTKDSGEAIVAAREAYDALTPEQQAKVENYRTLLDAEAAYAELTKPEVLTYEAVNSLSELNADDTYAIVLWRYFGGTNSDSYNGYLVHSENNNSLRAPSEDDYATITYADGNIPDAALWKIVPVDGGWTVQNVGSGKYLNGTAYPAASETGVALTFTQGVSGTHNNYVLGTSNTYLRYSNSSGSFSFNTSSNPASQVTGTNACNLTIYKVVGSAQPENPDAEMVQAVADAIAAIGEVTKDSGEAIVAAREAYDALTPEQQAKVENYQTLLDAEAAYAELTKPEVITYEAVNSLSELNADDTYAIVLWRYFGGTNSDSYNGYLVHSENNNSLRAPSEDDYATITYADGNIPDAALWKIVPVDGGWTVQNVGSGKYLNGTAYPAASETGVALTFTQGVSGTHNNYVLGTSNTYLRYSNSSGSFSFNTSSNPASQVTGTNACNLTIYKVVGGSEPVEPEGYTHKLIALSDFQWGSHTEYQNTAKSILTKMADDGVSDVELGILCGDYVDGSVYSDGSDTSLADMEARFAQIKGYVTDKWADAEFLAIQGNHDNSAWVKNGTLSATGPYEFEDYIVYMINEDDFPWWQAGYSSYSDTKVCKAAVEKTSADLNTYLSGLIEAGNEKPIIIATHVPMHWSSRTTTAAGWWSDNIYAKTLFDVVNEAALYQDIVFLFGHNHSESYSAAYPEGGTVNLFVPGDTIRIPDGRVASSGNYTEETINFVYTNAGYCGYVHSNFNPSVSTISLLTITEDEVMIEKYSPDGLYPSASYTIARGQKGKIAPRVTVSSEENPTTRREGNIESFLAALKHGTDPVYAWTVDNTEVVRFTSATDADKASVEYVGGGDAVITCTVTCTDEEGEQQTVSAQYAVSVKAKPAPGGTGYVQVTDLSKISEDKDYIIVLWRYFGGTEEDSTNGYVFHSENNGSIRAATEDEYATISGTFDKNAYWSIIPVEGGYKLMNVGTGKYLSTIPAVADEANAKTFTIAAGTCNGVDDFAIGDASSAIRYSATSGSFSFSSTGAEAEASRAWAANVTIYEVVKTQSGADFTKLDEAINAAGTLNEEDYTDESWAELVKALENAIKVAENTGAAQDEVDAACKALTDAMEALVTDVGEAIAHINAIGDITKDAKPVIDTARAAYDALSAEQKAQVTNYDALTAAEAAYADLLKAYDDLTAAIAEAAKLPTEDYTAATAAALSEALTDAGEAAAATDLTKTAVAAAAAAVREAVSGLEGKSREVIALIDAIGTVSADSKPAIDAARAAYDALSIAQKSLVSNYPTLRRAEVAYENLPSVPELDYRTLKAALKAVEALNADDYTAPSWSALNAARAFGNKVLSLSATSQQVVDAAAEAVNAAVEALIGKELAVIEQIAAIGTVGEGSKTVIDAARAAYEALPPAQQAKVTNYDALCKAEQAYADLPTAPELDYDVLDAVIKAAAALNEADYTPVTWAQLAKALARAEAARADALTQLAVDGAAEALNDAINVLTGAAEPVVAQITAIGEVTAASAPVIKAARAAYNALTPAQKAKVSNYAALVAAEQALDNLAAESAADLTVLDAALKAAAALDAADYTAPSWSAFNAARAYAEKVRSLDGAAQKVIDAAAQTLSDAMDALVGTADAVRAKIDAIGSVTAGSADAIKAAREAYNALTPAQKAKVTNYAVLAAAEKALANLPGEPALDYSALDAALAAAKLDKADFSAASWADFAKALASAEAVRTGAKTQVAIDGAAEALESAISRLVGASEAVIALIDAIGPVTAASEPTIEAARAAYDALSSTEKAKVANYDVLAASEKAFANLPAAPKADFSELEAALKAAAKLTADDYTDASWFALNAARTYAEKILNQADSAQSIVDAATDALNAAADALVGKADAVAERIAGIAPVTTASGEAIAAARSAFDALTPAQKAKVRNYADLLDAERAYADLTAAPAVDYSALSVAVQAADALNADDYTDESWAEVAAALTAAYKAFAADTQENVDSAAEALNQAVAALEAKQQECPSKNFIDVPGEDHWAHEGIDYCVAKGLMNGVSDTIFNPEGTVTRAQLVTILYRIEGEPETAFKGIFTDVKAGQWYTAAIEWAAAEEIVNGKSEGRFDPMGEITREQIAAILYRYSGEPEVKGELEFPDADKVSAYAVNAMVWATSEGLINGIASGEEIHLAPQANATRAQIASIIMRYLEK